MRKNRAAVALGQLRKRKAAQGELPTYQEIGKKGGDARAKSLTDLQRKEIASAAGKSGGAARAAKLTPEQRREIAQKAAARRWGK